MNLYDLVIPNSLKLKMDFNCIMAGICSFQHVKIEYFANLQTVVNDGRLTGFPTSISVHTGNSFFPLSEDVLSLHLRNNEPQKLEGVLISDF